MLNKEKKRNLKENEDNSTACLLSDLKLKCWYSWNNFSKSWSAIKHTTQMKQLEMMILLFSLRLGCAEENLERVAMPVTSILEMCLSQEHQNSIPSSVHLWVFQYPHLQTAYEKPEFICLHFFHLRWQCFPFHLINNQCLIWLKA